jgi:hypothetical protein
MQQQRQSGQHVGVQRVVTVSSRCSSRAAYRSSLQRAAVDGLSKVVLLKQDGSGQQQVQQQQQAGCMQEIVTVVVVSCKQLLAAAAGAAGTIASAAVQLQRSAAVLVGLLCKRLHSIK